MPPCATRHESVVVNTIPHPPRLLGCTEIPCGAHLGLGRPTGFVAGKSKKYDHSHLLPSSQALEVLQFGCCSMEPDWPAHQGRGGRGCPAEGVCKGALEGSKRAGWISIGEFLNPKTTSSQQQALASLSPNNEPCRPDTK